MTNTKIQLADGLQACRQSFIAVGTFSGVANLLMLVPAFFMLNVYDKAVGHNSVETLWSLSLITLFLFLMLGVMEVLRSRLLVAISVRLDKILAPVLYRLTFKNAVCPTGDYGGMRPLTDLQSLRQFLTGQPIFAIFDAPWLPVYLAVLFLFHPLLGWIGVSSAVIFFVLALLNQRFSAAPLKKANELLVKHNAITHQNLRNAEAGAAMGMMPALQARWRKRQDQILVEQESASHVSGGFNAAIKTLRLLVQSTAIAAGAFLVLKQEISPGMIIAGSILVSRALQPVEQAVGAWRGFSDAKREYQSLEKMLSDAPEVIEQMEQPPIEGMIEAQGASVLPPGARRETLAGVTFSLPKGKVCMVVGPSGAGKSTFVRALMGLWPTARGEIKIDGLSAAKHNREALGAQLGYLPQDIEIFDGTVSENIARFGEIDAESVTQAAMDAGIHELILSFENAYDTKIGGHASQLSPGQRQRLALARALYNRPKLVVLDEPNSNLDEAGEFALSNAIGILRELGSTVVIVSHRQALLSVTDYVLVIVDGTVHDFAERDTVLSRSPFYTGAGRATPASPAGQKDSAGNTASFRAPSWRSNNRNPSG